MESFDSTKKRVSGYTNLDYTPLIETELKQALEILSETHNSQVINF